MMPKMACASRRNKGWWVVLAATALLSVVADGFEWSATGRPEVTRRAIAGLWRLKPQPTFPIKEFTVHPKKPSSSSIQQQELLLMLKEDGSFQQYLNQVEEDDEDDDDEGDVSDKWKKFMGSKQQPPKSQDKTATTQPTVQSMSQTSSNPKDPSESLTQELVKGVWDYRDGKLILAADRPDEKEEQIKASSDGMAAKQQQEQAQQRRRQYLDKLIVGRVKISYETSLQDNPILNMGKNETENQATATDVSTNKKDVTQQSNTKLSKSTKNNDEATLDAHLSVPKGSLKVGKFFYPKHHPSFFEQPIYNPVTLQPKYELKQVLGSLNTQQQQQEDDMAPDKFLRSDFYNKTFLLTSSPLPQSPMYKKWIAKYQEDNKLKPNLRDRTKVNPFAESSQIRVMQVRFFPNNTFATVGGVGGNILRGRFDTFTRGTQFWMQVSRFGIGRGVSGSVYSEGRTLTHEDAKTYWGTIDYQQHEGQNATAGNATTPLALERNNEDGNEGEDSTTALLLEVKGSVLYGTGLTAEPVGKFLMREMEKEELIEMEDDDEDDEEDDEDDDEEDDEDDYISDETLGTTLPSTLSFDDPDDGRSFNDEDDAWDDTNAFQ